MTSRLPAARIEFWSVVMGVSIAVIGLLLIWPIAQVLVLGFLHPETQTFTLANYAKVLTHRYYLGALGNTLIVGIGGMVGACLLGIPLAYCTARYVVKGRSLIATLAVLVVIIPAVLVERVFDQRRAHDPLNLLPGHAGAQLGDHRLVNIVALANRNRVETGQQRFTAGGGQNQQQDADGA